MDKVFQIINQEKKRQKEQLEMIPSENYASAAVMKAVGSCLMNKYAEGYPKRRYYQGNANVDRIESLCRNRVLKAFALDKTKWSVNVQPHSGCEANVAVYNALLPVGSKIMSMYLPDGGHLSHGWHMPGKKITFVSKIYRVQFYHVDKKTLVFDYDQIERQAKNYRPHLIISGGTAYPREINYRRLSQIARSVGALYLADVAHEAGLIAAGVMKPPFPYADVVTFTTHKTWRGPRGAVIIARKKLIDQVNFSIIPGLQGGPHMHTIAGISVATKELMTPAFKRYAQQVVVNAQTLAREFVRAGLKVISGGTDKHLVLIDLRSQGLTGWVVAWALEAANIVANRNTVPYDTGSPFYPSGLRLGTPALTSRGMKVREMQRIAGWIVAVINYLKDKNLGNNKATIAWLFQDKFLHKLGTEVKRFSLRFPVPGL